MINRYLRTLRKSYANYRGWSTKRKLVLFESDDWGSIRIKDQKSFSSLQNKGIDLSVSRYTKYDKLEEEEDLDAIFSILKKFNDINGNHPVFSANYLVANPDFEKIKTDDFLKYHYLNLEQSYDRYSGGRYVMFNLIREGIENKIFTPQFHGREHLHPLRWLKCLSVSKKERQSFDFECVPGVIFSRNSSEYIPYMSAFDYFNEDERKYSHSATEDGLNLFEQTFGFKSKTFIPSQSVMGNDLFSTLTKNGVQLSKAGARILPSSVQNNQKMTHDFWGYSKKYDIYFSRANCNFEPNKDSRDWVSACLADIELAFRFGKPAVISTHRVNYIGGREQMNRTDSLRSLEKLIRKLLDQYKNIEFVDSSTLCEIIKVK
jgi:hypothetical protein